MVRQIAIKFDETTYRRFRGECIKRGTTPTRVLNEAIKRQVAEWETMPASVSPHEEEVSHAD